MATKRTRSSVPPARGVQPTFRNTWPIWLWLVITAVLWYAAGPALLVIAALAFCFTGLFWLCDRYPRTMIVLLGFLRGLLGGRR
jgi:hypothetical protein